MRIRSIKPEFWRSDDISKLCWNDRLLFIGLWSYVDDNGVGRDDERLIVADLFPLDEPLSESSVRTHDGLMRLQAADLIVRYEVKNRNYLCIKTWAKHQRINRPSPGRYPPPTSEFAIIHDVLTEPSVSHHVTLSAGTGNREQGTGDQGSLVQSSENALIPAAPADAVAERPENHFDEFWQAYPRRTNRKLAEQKYSSALKRGATEAELIAAAITWAQSWKQSGTEQQFIPHPATWLNQDRWREQPEVIERKKSGPDWDSMMAAARAEDGRMT